MDYTVNIDAFEGPFDLLLHLIQKKEISIYDVSISEITGQYMETIRQWQEMNLEIASEFIVMASRLLEIKSKDLLPRKENPEGEEETEEDLIQQLIAYQAFKTISGYLGERGQKEEGALYKDPENIPAHVEPGPLELDSQYLADRFRRLLSVYEEDHTFRHYEEAIERESYTIEDQLQVIRSCLINASGGQVLFSDLFKSRKRSEVIVTFQALLELYKTNSIGIQQYGNFKEMAVFKRF